MSSKLTGLPVVTSLDSADLVYAVDVSDTTDDPAGTSVAITRANLVGGGGGALTNLGTITNATPANFDWDGIDLAQYDRLYIRGHVWDTTTVAGERSLWFNGDFTDANYRAQRGYSVNSSNVAAAYASSATISRVHGTDGKTDGKTNIDITIEAPGLTGKLKAAINQCLNQDKTATHLVIDRWAMEHKTITAALTRVTFESCEGELTLFGEKNADATGGSGYAAGTVVTEEIGRLTDPVSGEFDFDSIPSGYDRLILKGNVDSLRAIQSDNVQLFFNADTTPANYKSELHYGAETSSAGVKNSTAQIGFVGGTVNAIGVTQLEIVVEDPDSANAKIATATFGYRYNTDALIVGTGLVVSTAVSAAITRLRLQSGDAAQDLTGTLILYGERTV